MNSLKKWKPARREESQLTQLSAGVEDNWTLPIFKGIISKEHWRIKEKTGRKCHGDLESQPTSSLKKPSSQQFLITETQSGALNSFYMVTFISWFSVWRPSWPQTHNPPASASQGCRMPVCLLPLKFPAHFQLPSHFKLIKLRGNSDFEQFPVTFLALTISPYLWDNQGKGVSGWTHHNPRPNSACLLFLLQLNFYC